VTAVAVYSYRLGWNSVQVSEQLGIKPPMVRIWLLRMCILARKGTKACATAAYRKKVSENLRKRRRLLAYLRGGKDCDKATPGEKANAAFTQVGGVL
jgi:hypothetical protein